MTVLVRGGGDLASGVAYRLFHAGLKLIITEVPNPLAVRRLVSFSEAVYQGEVEVEGIRAVRVDTADAILETWQSGKIPVIVDPPGDIRLALQPQVIIDARMMKKPPELGIDAAPLVLGLGPGFTAGENCHAVVETMRGHTLGRVIWEGSPKLDTGIPETVNGRGGERVLRAPVSGELVPHAAIGDHVRAGQVVAEVGGQSIPAPFDGVLRGLLRAGIDVKKGLKIGDVDPRDNPDYCRMVSEKSLAIGGGVLEAILSQGELRAILWS